MEYAISILRVQKRLLSRQLWELTGNKSPKRHIVENGIRKRIADIDMAIKKLA
jgi:hypothetical protein